VKRKKLTDEDIVSVVKDQAKTFAEDQVYRELDAWRKRAKIQYSAAYAPAPAESIPKISY
jgi:Fe2+ or Zn2+ uptake regulation protein